MLLADLLIKDNDMQVLPLGELMWVIIVAKRNKEGRKQKWLIDKFDGELLLLTQFTWKDGVSIFYASTSQLCHLLSSALAPLHATLKEWIDRYNWDGNVTHLW